MWQVGYPLLAFLVLVCGEGAQKPPKPSDKDISNFKDTQVPNELAKAIDQAVDRGVAWLRTRQEADGSFRFAAMRQAIFGDFPLGLTALSTMALLASGVSREDMAIQRAMRFILDHPTRTTYEAGLVLMALDMKAAPSWERRILEGMTAQQRKNYHFPRVVNSEERRRIEEDVSFLLQAATENYWSYGLKSGLDGDISNTQFAILGLKAASRCSVPVPEIAFEKLLRCVLSAQAMTGKKVNYPKVIFNKLQGNYVIDIVAQARGWGYFFKPYKVNNDVTGSRTNIGLACIALCREELVAKGSDDAKAKLKLLQEAVELAIQDGLAWLDSHFSVEKNPGTEEFGRKGQMPMNGFWYYYYMYSIERTGALLVTRYIGRHDWYREGAESLLRRQDKDGSWTESNAVIDTAFALLFLRRATTPSVLTGIR